MRQEENEKAIKKLRKIREKMGEGSTIEKVARLEYEEVNDTVGALVTLLGISGSVGYFNLYDAFHIEWAYCRCAVKLSNEAEKAYKDGDRDKEDELIELQCEIEDEKTKMQYRLLEKLCKRVGDW